MPKREFWRGFFWQEGGLSQQKVPSCANESMPLDRSRGRLIHESGVDYYSPNCSRTIQVPKETDPNKQQFPMTLGWKDFTEPRWWTDTHGWLAFVPREPMLDLDLLHVTRRLLAAYQIAAIAPYSPRAKGYRASFTQPHSIKKAAMLSRDWFFCLDGFTILWGGSS
ncbi:uncharacterized protein LACBIDRAFT_323093 [Laccaria bicolor S238N-H82]|uniref:Predicted protein n=1 Tax=Laccaria bicolor (strain S238N-H82 / ATCC MYA-4686) TaxID=486041 RepID=B0CW37_LACBS|nr:uncharacterized protein LACBIDRAFT_323093 [Laccaria bicolor S238N-H82]EDR13444.1 predicted protein [Laccaria bicolor S238N-H82]|eukprot:XP_001875942.1 predicted protein [Laccaria bicolor S238N-H82]